MDANPGQAATGLEICYNPLTVHSPVLTQAAGNPILLADRCNRKYLWFVKGIKATINHSFFIFKIF